MGRATNFSPGVKDRVVRLPREHQPEYGSQYESVCSVAEKIGCHFKALRGWVRRSEMDDGVHPGVTTE